MASGVKVDDDVKNVYGQISLKTVKHEKLKFAVFKFSDDVSRIVTDYKGKIGDDDWQYEPLIAKLPGNDVRYIAYEFMFRNQDQTPGGKMVLISWCPSGSPIKKKMLVASSFNALKATLNPQVFLEGDCHEDISSSEVLKKCGGAHSEN